jgi:hypothetical protein
MMRVLASQVDVKLGDRVTEQAARLQAASEGQGDVGAEARAMQELAEEVARRIETMQFSPNQMRELSVALADEGLSGNYSDYSGAEQALLSLGSIIDFRNREHMLANPAEVAAKLNSLNALLRNDEHFSPADFRSQLKDLRAILARA